MVELRQRLAPVGTQSIERAIALLREVAVFGKQGARLTDLIERCDIEYPTAHRIVKSLVTQALLSKDTKTRRYYLGPLVYELGLAAAPTIDAAKVCDAMTTNLAEQTGDTIFLNTRSGRDVVCVDRKEGPYPIRIFVFDVGSRRPLGVGAAGVALLMTDTPVQVAEIAKANETRYRDWTGVTRAGVVEMVERGRKLGYVAIDDAIFPGLRAVSVPFAIVGCRQLMAVTVAAVSSRLPRARILELVAVIEGEIGRLPQAHLVLARGSSA